ncbi:N-acetylneuraminate synthase family protein [Alphaproteobacteria bacterium]|nr:N-acetylneuraminate synthase family protein [Alphaproteobacteria bacterium]
MFFIAEIGVNHNGDINIAKKLIDSAKAIGCNAVKFQTFTAKTLASELAPKVDYQKITSNELETHYTMLKNLELSVPMHQELFQYCKIKNIEFISTAYHADDVTFLSELGVDKIKTASADLIDHTIHKRIVDLGLKPIVAVGMASFAEISETLKIYENAANKPILLHCVSNYPCEHQSINLSVLHEIKKDFQVEVGYSDHSVGSDAAALSVAYGATIIEKHFTLDKTMEGPDHLASSTPIEFKELIDKVSLAEKIIGKPVKRLQEEEKGMYLYSRKSIFTTTQVKSGERLTEANMCLLRPGTGIPANKYFNFLGQKVSKDLEPYHMLQEEDL